MNSTTPTESVLAELATWPGVTTQPTRRGATAILFDGLEIGHVHRDRRTLDVPLPDDRRAEVLAAGRARKWFSDWVSKPTRERRGCHRRHRAAPRELRRAANGALLSRLLTPFRWRGLGISRTRLNRARQLAVLMPGIITVRIQRLPSGSISTVMRLSPWRWITFQAPSSRR
jgi:Luciferase